MYRRPWVRSLVATLGLFSSSWLTNVDMKDTSECQDPIYIMNMYIHNMYMYNNIIDGERFEQKGLT